MVSRPARDKAIVFSLVFPTFVTWLYFIVLAHEPALLQYVAFGVGKTIQFAFPLVWVCLIERRRPQVDWPKRRGLGVGAVSGAIVLVAIVALYHAGLEPLGVLEEPAEHVREKVHGLGIDGVGKYVAMAIFYALAHSLLEEYYRRWIVFGQLRETRAVRWAILISSVGFMAHHVLVLSLYFGWLSAATVFFSLAVAVGGAFWAWLYQRCGTLYAPWLSHALVDLAIFVVGFDMVHQLLH